MAEDARACSNRRRALIGSLVTPPTTGAIEIERGGDENTTINHGCWQGEAGQQAVATSGTMIARGGTATARGSRATGGTTTGTGSTTTVTGGTRIARGGTATAREAVRISKKKVSWWGFEPGTKMAITIVTVCHPPPRPSDTYEFYA
jgi:hypothetical protein